MRENILFHTHLSRTRSFYVRRGAFHTSKDTVVSIGQGQTHRRTARRTGAFWRIRLAPTTLETTRRRPFLQVFGKGRLPALASPLETP
jgi:hypothetical protein